MADECSDPSQLAISGATRARDVARFLRLVFDGIFVVPETHVYVLDVAWQLYAFEVFHRRVMNRLIHVVGIVASTIAMYALLDEVAGIGWVAALALAAFHLELARRVRERAMAFAIGAVHGALWLAARALGSTLAEAPRAPLLTFFGIIATAALVQALAHAPEPWIPAPIAGGPRWARLGDWWRGMSARRAAWFLLLPGYVLVEALSAPRNLFVVVALVGHRLGLSSAGFRSLEARIASIVAAPNPPLRRADFRAAITELS